MNRLIPALPRSTPRSLLSARDLAATAGPFVLLTLALLAVAYWVLDPTPPRHVVLATGAAQGAYAEFGKRYQAFLKPYGVEVELRNTQGAAENLALLRDPSSGVDIAFLQGGADEALTPQPVSPDEHLESLGSLFYEPVWLFYRESAARRLLKADTLTSLAQLNGWRVNVGTPGSGAPNLFMKLLDANHIDMSTITLQRQPQTSAVMALIAGDTDAVVFTSAPEALMIQMLLQTPGVRLLDFSQAEAYSRRLAFLRSVTLPRGIVDLAGNVPTTDVHLVAPTATLVTRDTTHPALTQLFVQAATGVHREAGWFQRKGDFPSNANTERPLAKEADRFYRNGPPLLQRYLPFWLANLIDRMWVVLVSIIAILIPLSRVVPPLYQFRIRSRIFRWYAQLRAVETAHGRRPADDLERELDELESRVGAITVPLSYADQLYALRGHIAMVRRRLAEPVQFASAPLRGIR